MLDPIPNLYFTRDPFACIGNGVSLNHMYSRTRRRETLYGKYILKYHPDFAGKVPFYYDRTMDFAIEGGDILNLSNKVIAIGISQRTTPEAIEILAQNIFADETSEIETIIALDIPSVRAFMHLDTVCTQVDHDKFTIHPGIMQTLRIFEIKPGDQKGQLKVTESDAMLSDILAKYLELDKPEITAEVEEQGDAFVIHLKSSCFSPFTAIGFTDADVTLEDNFFHMTDGEEMCVRLDKKDIRNGEILDAADLTQQMEILTLA